MSPDILPITQAINENTTVFFDVARYCLSDKVSQTIDAVIQNSMSPSQYAREVTPISGKAMFDHFVKTNRHYGRRIPLDIQTGYAYDRLVEMAIFFRISQVRTESMEDAAALLVTTLPFMLTVNDQHTPESYYAGLSEFKTNISVFVDSFGLGCNMETIGLTSRLISAVGNISEKDWILHRSTWHRALVGRKELLRTLRGWLYNAIVAHVSTDRFIESMMETTRLTIVRDMEDFIGLIENKRTTVAAIRKFIEDVEHYSYEIHQQSMMVALYHLPFSIFAQEHQNTFQSLNPPKGVGSDVSSVERTEWKLLRDLGEEFSPEKMLDDETAPFDLVYALMTKQEAALRSESFVHSLSLRGVDFTNKEVMFPGWTRSIMSDALFCTLVERRLFELHEGNSAIAALETKTQSHILLVLEDDEDQQRGLSLVPDLLLYHSHNNLENISEREAEILSLLSWTWDRLSGGHPDVMASSWKQIVTNKNHIRYIRGLFFSIIETLNIPPSVQYESYLTVGNTNVAMSRDQFFSYVDNFCEYLTDSPTEEEITEFLMTMPMLNRTVILSEMDQCMWTMPFGAIPFQEEDD